MTHDTSTTTRPRDATNTRALLLSAARIRFARDGYATTTVRDIATDAGVNVSLINRYFESKEGLFEACLQRAVSELGSATPSRSFEQILRTMVHNVAGSTGSDEGLQLLLLLRSSGDERANKIRRDILRGYAEGMLSAAGREVDDDLLLRAELVIAVGMGIVLLRSSTTALEPLASATDEQLTEPLGQLLETLLKS